MKEAASYLQGRHNFAYFTNKKDRTTNKTINTLAQTLPFNTVRTINSISLEPYDPYHLLLQISAPSFLPHQVRCIVTILTWIGRGREKPSLVLEMLERAQRGSDKPRYGLASASGLVLKEVGYDDRDVGWVGSIQSKEESRGAGQVKKEEEDFLGRHHFISRLSDAQLLSFYSFERRKVASGQLWASIVAEELSNRYSKNDLCIAHPPLSWEGGLDDILRSDILLCKSGLAPHLERVDGYVPILKRNFCGSDSDEETKE
jgi:hypothetical protein